MQFTYATPTVSASLGTLDTSPSKNLAFAIIVSYANVFTLVLDVNDDPGSLNAMCPSGPIPKLQHKYTPPIHANVQTYRLETTQCLPISQCLPQILNTRYLDPQNYHPEYAHSLALYPHA